MYQVSIIKIGPRGGRKVVERRSYDNYEQAVEKLDYLEDCFQGTQYAVGFKNLADFRR